MAGRPAAPARRHWAASGKTAQTTWRQRRACLLRAPRGAAPARLLTWPADAATEAPHRLKELAPALAWEHACAHRRSCGPRAACCVRRQSPGRLSAIPRGTRQSCIAARHFFRCAGWLAGKCVRVAVQVALLDTQVANLTTSLTAALTSAFKARGPACLHACPVCSVCTANPQAFMFQALACMAR